MNHLDQHLAQMDGSCRGGSTETDHPSGLTLPLRFCPPLSPTSGHGTIDLAALLETEEDGEGIRGDWFFGGEPPFCDIMPGM